MTYSAWKPLEDGIYLNDLGRSSAAVRFDAASNDILFAFVDNVPDATTDNNLVHLSTDISYRIRTISAVRFYPSAERISLLTASPTALAT